MRKRSVFLLALIIVVFSLSFVLTGCWDDKDGTSTDGASTSQCIELSMDNYEYYLSIDKTVTSSGSISVGHYASYKVTISGAISGLFQNCSLYYKIGNGEEQQVKLNAAGFATFNYSWSSWNNSTFSFTRVEGKIIL